MANDVGISPLQEAKDPLSDDQVVSRLRVLCRSSKRTEVEIIRLLVILQARHLDLHWTYSSLYKFCAERLGMTEGEAARRVSVARLISKVPALLEYLHAGQLSMTTLLCLRDYVTPENAHELLPRVVSKSRREVQLVLAERSPHSPPRRRQVARVEPNDTVAPPPHPATEEGGYHVDVSSGSALHSKLELARQLMGRERAPGAVVGILDAALDALIAQLRAAELESSTASREGEASVPTDSTVAVPPPQFVSSARPLARLRPPRKVSTPTPSPTPSHDGRAVGTERSLRGRPRAEKPSAISQALRRPLKHREGRERGASKAPESTARRAREAP